MQCLNCGKDSSDHTLYRVHRGSLPSLWACAEHLDKAVELETKALIDNSPSLWERLKSLTGFGKKPKMNVIFVKIKGQENGST